MARPRKIKVGDKVRTKAGSKNNKASRRKVLTVLELDRSLGLFSAVLCKVPGKQNRLFLKHNLVHV